MTQAPLLAVRPRYGLCNRLLVLTSFEVLARHTGRAFLLCWAPGVGFSDEDLNDLFENRYERIDVATFEDLSERALCLHEKMRLEKGAGWQWEPEFGPDALRDGSRFPLVVYEGFLWVNVFKDSATGRQLPAGFRAACTERLRDLRPVGSIRSVVDDIAGSFDAATVGVHVRRGDAMQVHYSHWYKVSTDRAFFAAMDAMLVSDGRTRFFLATDSAETETRFRRRYGDAILTNPAKQFVLSSKDSAKENQRDAVIDLFALARTSRVLGNHGSSFSRTAARLGSVPLEVVISSSERARHRWRAARHKAGHFLGRGRD